jgi:hypothetical protein
MLLRPWLTSHKDSRNLGWRAETSNGCALWAPDLWEKRQDLMWSWLILVKLVVLGHRNLRICTGVEGKDRGETKAEKGWSSGARGAAPRPAEIRRACICWSTRVVRVQRKGYSAYDGLGWFFLHMTAHTEMCWCAITDCVVWYSGRRQWLHFYSLGEHEFRLCYWYIHLFHHLKLTIISKILNCNLQGLK